MTYSELQQRIAEWMDRDDLTSHIPGFISLCEAEVNRQLRTGDQERDDVVIPSVEGESSYTLPTTERGWRSVKVDNILRYLTPHSLDAPPWFHSKVVYYTLVNGKIKFNKPLDGAQQIELLGYAQVPALTVVDDTNWLLQAHEDVYLFGSLRYAELFVKNPEKAAQMESIFLDKMGQVIERDKLDRWSGDTLQMKSNRPRGLGRSRSQRCL